MDHLDFTIKALKPIFEGNGFRITERFTNYARFDSKFASVALSYDEREKSNNIFIGERSWNSHLLDEQNLKDVFGYDNCKQIITQPMDKFLKAFFSDKGKGILLGDTSKLQELDDYEKKRSKAYTNDLVRKQNIRIADKAWNKKDYLAFVEHIDLLDKESLPKSYALKYKMARDKIGGSN